MLAENVVPFPEPPAKILPAEAAGPLFGKRLTLGAGAAVSPAANFIATGDCFAARADTAC